jgi:membrane-bound lytic murein transglycosylase D
MGFSRGLIAGLFACLLATPLWDATSAKAAEDAGAQPQRVESDAASAPVAGQIDLRSGAEHDQAQPRLIAPDTLTIQQSSPFLLSAPKAVPPFPIQLNQYVRRYLADFMHAPDSLQDSFDRSRPYMAQMNKVLRSYGVPDDMVYLAFAESAFSGDQEKGIWQLSASTARRFGLHVDYYVDERRDPVLSTQAAAEYLASLHDVAGSDWRMAIVAWNNGDHAIDRYWSLRDSSFERLMRRLPHRTRALFGRFMAVAYIAHHDANYGLSLINFDAPPAFREIRVKGGVALRTLAAEYGTSIDKLRQMNPSLLGNWIPPWAPAYSVRVPLDTHASASDHSVY